MSATMGKAPSARAVAFLTTAMLASVASAALPYIPTTILGGADNRFYIFTPNGRSVDLLEVGFASTLSASSFKPKTLVSDLPFLGSSDRVAFTPNLLDNGILAVFAGDCSVATDAALWTYNPGRSGLAAWTKHTTAPSKSWDYGQGGPYFLGGSLSFAAQLAPAVSDPILYVYGGMCPSTNATGGQSSATYSNRMLKLSPPITRDASSYSVSYAPTAGPPVAEAGFTFTELAPSISNRSGIVTQQTGHVLLGGHTQQAFVNMSTAAIWSLPEETWNFVSISIPPSAGSGKNDLLAAKDAGNALAAATESVIDSRSGHTAVLSEDGTSLIILGGWVGDTTQAAEPQLAVINIGASFSDWQWKIPAAQPSGPGFYGHGAALLPGNVMMVYGGYDISGQPKLRRRATPQLFFNISTLSWTDTYTNPGYTLQHGHPAAPDSPSSPNSPSAPNLPGNNQNDAQESSSNKLPLGLGLGLGIPFLLITLALAFFFYHRRSKRRAQRDEAIRGLSQGISGTGGLPFHHRTDSGEMLERDAYLFPSWNGDSDRDWYTGGDDPYLQGRRSLGYESLRGGGGGNGFRGGNFAPLPPPMTRSRGAARGLYQPSTGLGGGGGGEYNPLRMSLKNEIHPIYEDDEPDEKNSSPLSPTHEELDDDPFATPTRSKPGTPTTGLFHPSSVSGSGSARGDSPERGGVVRGGGGQSQNPEVHAWVSDVDATDAVVTAKIVRHGSTTTTPPKQGLHPQSAGVGRGSPQRRNSNRSRASDSPDDRTNSSLSDRSSFSFVAGGERNVSVLRQPKQRSGDASRAGTSGSSTSAGTFSTAKSTFAALQAEGPGLLAGEQAGEEGEEWEHVPGSPSKSKPPRRSWLGSLKRVFSGGTPSDGSSSGSPTRENLLGGEGEGGDYEGRLVGMGKNGVLVRRKQGREAWDGIFSGGGGGEGEGSGGREGEDEDWDIERAVEHRLVQVMFTVPKERLRVVNAEVEREEEVVVVSPREGEGDESSFDERAEGSGERKGKEREERNERLSRDIDQLLDLPEKEPTSRGRPRLSYDETSRLAEERLTGDERPRTPSPSIPATPRRTGKDLQAEAEKAAASLLLLLPEAAIAGADRDSAHGISPSASLRTSSMTTATLHTAEALRLERPRTRVLEMVESIESKSTGSTPGGSPTRG